MVAYCMEELYSSCELLHKIRLSVRQTTTGLILHTARVGCSTFHPAASREVVAPNLSTLSVNSDNDKVHCEQLTNTNTYRHT